MLKNDNCTLQCTNLKSKEFGEPEKKLIIELYKSQLIYESTTVLFRALIHIKYYASICTAILEVLGCFPDQEI